MTIEWLDTIVMRFSTRPFTMANLGKKIIGCNFQALKNQDFYNVLTSCFQELAKLNNKAALIDSERYIIKV